MSPQFASAFFLCVKRFRVKPLRGGAQDLRWYRLAEQLTSAYLVGLVSDAEYDSLRSAISPYVD